MNLYELMLGDCLERMKELPDHSVDMILCDLPYGTTSCKWDSVIPFDQLWSQYWRLLKSNGVAVLTAAQPFTTNLITSQIENFRYCWYWVKPGVTGFANAKKQPLRCVEDVAVFYRTSPAYFPQGLKPYGKINKRSAPGEILGRTGVGSEPYVQEFTNYPRQTLEFGQTDKKVHPTQKPVALMEYLIRTYTIEGDTVLDNCMGSGTTGVACMNTGRRFIGIEREPTYFDICKNRILDASNWNEEAMVELVGLSMSTGKLSAAA